MDKRFLGILVAVIVVLGGIFWISSRHQPSTAVSGQPTNHVEGQGQDGVKLVEYGDYQCPYCEEYYPIVKQVVSDYTTQIFFQFRNLPLTELHQNAFAGARAAEAASLQGQFWGMHDLLYDDQSQWSTASNPQTYFDSYATQLGINLSKFEQDFDSDQVNNSINADISAFNATGQQEATPTFFLDGTHITPEPTVASFAQLINAAIKKKGFTPPAIPSSTSTTTTTGGQSVQ